MKRLFFGLVGLLFFTSPAVAPAQELIEGEVFDFFRPTDTWSLVGSVAAVEDERQFLSTPAQGDTPPILLNVHGPEKAPYLFTAEDYGDVAVSIEFMIPKSSNSGLYFMGRYEVQIRDSAAEPEMTFADLGAIYERWNDDEPDPKKRGYGGVAPTANAAKAPGEWQLMEIIFRAPRFDADGHKSQNARFVSVHVNGKQVQDNTEVTGPTRSHPLQGEAPAGPLAIQGDHGPIAIRSLQLRALSLD